MQLARERLHRRIGRTTGRAATARQDAERGLLVRLSQLSGEAFDALFWKPRPYHEWVLARLDGGREPSDVRYRAFVREQLDGGLLEAFREYPVLARVMAIAVRSWVDSTAEMIERLEADFDRLCESFGVAPTAQVAALRGPLSDPHHGGRAVMTLEFSCGTTVVYKPKPLAPERNFNRLLDWCNRRDRLLELHVTTVLDRGEYGWVAHVAGAPCDDALAVERFYVRAGMLLCLLYLLRGTDCHHENLIAHGEHPVLIDAETLLYHEPRRGDADQRARSEADSVLRTGLLPRWQADRTGTRAYDVSGLGAVEDELSRDEVRWHHVGTDDMHCTRETVRDPAGPNAPTLGGRTGSPMDHAPQLTEGFTGMYRFIQANREALLAADGPVAPMRSQRARYLVRPTRVYGRILEAVSAPDLLRSHGAFANHLEQVTLALEAVPDEPGARSVIAAEMRALQRLDIPHFTAQVTDAALELGDGAGCEPVLGRPSYDAVLDLLWGMGEDDLAQQCAIIEASLEAKDARSPSDRTSAPARVAAARGGGDFVAQARAIGLELERRALRDPLGGMNWLGLGYLEPADRFELTMMGTNLYDGRAGVALFLAALSAVTGEERFATLAQDAVASARRLAAGELPQHGARLHGIGGASGLGGIAYCLAHVARWLDDPSLLTVAVAIARRVTPEAIAADERLDVVAGSAGALLGLLTVHGLSGDPHVLRGAIECGDHLCRRLMPAGQGLRAWPTHGDLALTGFAHGAAGIAYALARLHAVTGDLSYFDAAVAGIEYERSALCEDDAVKWCHGAPGVALGRVGCLGLAVDRLEEEIEIGLRATENAYLQDADFLCCGNLGRAEAFLVAGSELGRPEWRRLAVAGAAHVVSRARDNGRYTLFGDMRSVYNPGFFQGMAGIGYQLLRTGHGELPSVLLWQCPVRITAHGSRHRSPA